MEKAILEVIDLSVKFPTKGNDVEALKNISFSLKAGEALGILGESGSGKSVSALSIMNLVPSPGRIINGSILYSGMDLLILSESDMRSLRGSEISMVFQDPLTAFNPVYTVGKQLLHVIQTHKHKSKKLAYNRALEVLSLVGLPDPVRVFYSYPHQLSGGMRQRALIGMALACEPKILIADEPTTALDVTIQSQIVQLFHKLRKQLDLTLIYITHNLDLMAELCDRAIVMYEGEIVEEGDVKSLFNSPQHSYTRMLIDCVPRLNKPENNKKSIPNKNDKSNLTSHNIQRKQLNNKDPIIEFQNVYKDFFIETNIINSIFGSKKTLQAVADFNLKICKGDIIGIVGESGSGKSTVAMLALHLLSISSGNIYYRRKNIKKLKGLELKSFRHNVQMVFQDNQSALNPRKTILKTLNEALIIRHGRLKNINQMAEDLLLSMGLDLDILERYPHSLSGGQRQRVGIARAMAMEPEIIVADEPVSSLDVSLQTQIIKLFIELHHKHNLTLIFISHDLALVSHLCKRLIVMQDGKIVEAGNAVDIMMHPSHPYTQNLINSVPKGVTEL